MAKYRVRDGEVFRGAKTVAGKLADALAGDVIELADDVAALHGHRLEPVNESTDAAAPATDPTP